MGSVNREIAVCAGDKKHQDQRNQKKHQDRGAGGVVLVKSQGMEG